MSARDSCPALRRSHTLPVQGLRLPAVGYALLLQKSLGPISCLFVHGFLGSHSLAVSLSSHRLSTDRSLLELVLELVP